MQLSALRTPKHTAADIGLETQSIYYLTSSKTIKIGSVLSNAGFNVILYRETCCKEVMYAVQLFRFVGSS